MEMTLSALVRSALSEADQQLKLASAQDVVNPLDTMAKLAAEMGPASKEEGKMTEEEKEEEEKKKRKEEAKEEKTSALSLASHSLKLAEALDHVGTMWTKMSTAMPTFEGAHNVGDTTQHAKTSPATVPAGQASHGGGPSENSQGYPNGINTNTSEFKTPEWKGNPEAKGGAIRVKGAKPGETAAGKTAAEQSALLHRFGGKFAADPSSPQATGLGTSSNPGKLDMVPPNPTEIPDNAGMISMTKRKAKTDLVKGDASKVLREPALSKATDKGISNNLSQDGGNKLSSFQAGAGRAFLAKIASAAQDPHASPQMRVKVAKFKQALARINSKLSAEQTHEKSLLRQLHESQNAQTGMGVLGGGALGGVVGAKLTPAKYKALAALGGTALGATAGGLVGNLNARANRTIYKGTDRLRGSTGRDTVHWDD